MGVFILSLLIPGRPLQAQRVIRSGHDLAAALADPEVTNTVLAADIALYESDWEGYPMPIHLTRNLSIIGVAGPLGGNGMGGPVVAGTRPVVDMRHLQGKVQFGERAVLNVSNVILVNAVSGNYNMAPRLDLLAPSLPSDSATLIGHNSLMVMPLCYPPELQEQAALVPRPEWLPGIQSVSATTSAPDCIASSNDDITVGIGSGDSGAVGGSQAPAPPAPGVSPAPVVPFERRCWAQRGAVDDLAFMGTALDAAQKQVYQGYAVQLINVTYLCAEQLSYECIAELGTVGCITARLLYGKALAPPPPLSQQPVLAPEPPAQPTPAGGGGGRGGGLLGAALGGASGGGLALAACVAAVLGVLRRRRRRELQREALHAPKGSSVAAGQASETSGTDDGVLGADADKQRGHTDKTDGGAARGGGAGGRARSIVCDWHSRRAEPERSEAGSLRVAASLQASTARTTGSAGTHVLTASEGMSSGRAGPHASATASSAAASSAAASSAAASSAAASSSWRHTSGLHSSSTVTATADPLFVLSPDTPQRPDLCLLHDPTHGSLSSPSLEVELLPTVLGKGGFGRVVEGRYRGVRVAVKLILDDWMGVWGLKASHGTGGGGAGVPATGAVDAHKSTADEGQPGGSNTASQPPDGDPASHLAQALAAEVEVLGRCCHPNILALYAACLTPPRLCLVMERMDTSLDKLIYGNPGQLIPLEEVVSIALDVARGLEYLHPTVVHRDVKPGNVLVNNPGTSRQVAKLADFGLARLRDSMAMWTENPEVGTPEYMAPELYNVDNNIVTHKVDVYAFGVLLWAMLSGQRPWAGLQMVVIAYRVNVQKERPPLGAIPPERLPPKLSRLLRQCWDAVPERRPAAAELVKGLLLLREQISRGSADGMELSPKSACPVPNGAADAAAVGPEPAALGDAHG